MKASANWELFRQLIAERAKPRTDSVELSAGGATNSYLDLKGYFTGRWPARRLAWLIHDACAAVGIRYQAIGGPTMGADFISHAVVHTYGTASWFSVRDEPKDHGLQRLIEGVTLHEGHDVLLVDDVVSSGKSLLKAFDAVRDTGAKVVGVMPIVHRGEWIWETVGGAPYCPLFTYEELGIDPL